MLSRDEIKQLRDDVAAALRDIERLGYHGLNRGLDPLADEKRRLQLEAAKRHCERIMENWRRLRYEP